MPTDVYTIKSGDTDPPFQATLRDGKNKVVPVVSGDVVRFHMVPQIKGLRAAVSGVCIFDATRTDGDGVLAGQKGFIAYLWQAGDTAVPGLYNVEVEVTFVGGGVRTFPSEGYFPISISDDLI